MQQHYRFSSASVFMWAILAFVACRPSTQALSQVSKDLRGQKIYDEVGEFRGSRALVVKDKKYGFVNLKGKLVVPLMYDAAYPFSEGRAAVKREGKWGFIDRNNNIIIPFDYEAANPFREGMAGVQQGGKWGFINMDNKLSVPFKYEYCDIFSQGLGAAKLNKKWGFVDKRGDEVVPFIFDSVTPYDQTGQSKVNRRGQVFWIDLDGNCSQDCDQ